MEKFAHVDSIPNAVQEHHMYYKLIVAIQLLDPSMTFTV